MQKSRSKTATTSGILMRIEKTRRIDSTRRKYIVDPIDPVQGFLNYESRPQMEYCQIFIYNIL